MDIDIYSITSSVFLHLPSLFLRKCLRFVHLECVYHVTTAGPLGGVLIGSLGEGPDQFFRPSRCIVVLNVGQDLKKRGFEEKTLETARKQVRLRASTKLS